MDKRRAYEGQTLVELALVLPCFCLGIFMAVQLMTYCHNMVELQRMSMVALHRVTIENYKDAYKHYWFHSLYGNVTKPQDHFASQIPNPWRPFHGKSTIQDTGRIVNVTVKCDLLPEKGFSQVLPRVSQSAQAEVILEAPLPEDN